MSRSLQRSAERLALVVLLALVALYAASPIFSVDFFWHLKLGELIRDTGAIPRTDVFSAVHPERPYVQFNWLWELLAAWVVDAWGLRGMRALQALVLVASYALLYRNTRRAFGTAGLALAFCALAVVMFEDRFRARPSALVLGFFALMLPLLLDASARARRSAPAFVLGIAVSWANLHGGESVLLVLSLGAVLAGELAHDKLLRRQDARPARAALLLGLAALGLLLSPTLVDGIRHWLTAVGPQIDSGNQEWLPSYTMLRNGVRPAFVLVGLGPTLVALLYVAEQARRVRAQGKAAIDVREWLLCAGYLVLAHHAVRNAFLCLLPLAFMLQRHASALRAEGAAARAMRSGWIAAASAATLLAISFEDAVLYGYGSLERARVFFAHDVAPDTYPEHAARFMAEAQIEGGILNDGRWGGYLSWLLWPRCGTFVDSRHNLTPEMWPIFLQSHDPLRRPPVVDAAFARYGTELTAFRAPTFPVHAPSRGWHLLFKAGDEEIFQHERGAHARENFERARRWLVAHGEPNAVHVPDEALGAIATRVGAALWLAEPMQRLRTRSAAQKTASADASTRAAGLREQGALAWQAGLFRDATSALEAALALEPEHVTARYHAALAYFAQGEPQRARAQLPVLLRLQKQLSPTQRGRMALLSRALDAQAAAAP